MDEAASSLKKNLKERGFGVLWQLNFKDKLKEKGLKLENDYLVFEVCNPKQAKEMLEFDPHVGSVLPCKMTLRRENGKTYIGMTSPEVLIGLFKNSELDAIAKRLTASLVESIEASL